MAQRAVPPPGPSAAQPTVDQMKRGIARIQKRIADLEAFEPESVQKRWPPEAKALENSIEEALTVAFGYGTVGYRRYEAAARLDDGPLVGRFTALGGGRYPQDARDARQYLAEGKQRSLLLLRQAVRGLEEEVAERDDPISLRIADRGAPTPDLTKVFIVHGHDSEAKSVIARFVEKLGIEAVILHEQPNKGRTIISKFREEAADTGFAVVLMTPDDLGKAKDAAELRPRARQNVVFELGFFIGALGPDRVVALVKGGIERPSDFDGVVYISLDNSNWQMELARELKAAGYDVDLNKVIG